MSQRRKITLVVTALLVGGCGWIAYRVVYTMRHIPEAYAAWDTGTLLVQYLEKKDGHWPTSWDDLATAGHYEPGVYKGASGGSAAELRQYVDSLKNRIAIDWTFDPRHDTGHNPVTPIAGGTFKVTWEEPNEMIRESLKRRASTRPTS